MYSVQYLLSLGLKKVVGNEIDINFWYDTWYLDCPLGI
jgi:hypothetical protein